MTVKQKRICFLLPLFFLDKQSLCLSNKFECVWRLSHIMPHFVVVFGLSLYIHSDSRIWRFISGWWFGTISIFPYIGNNDPNWLIFFRGVETTNQNTLNPGFVVGVDSGNQLPRNQEVTVTHQFTLYMSKVCLVKNGVVQCPNVLQFLNGTWWHTIVG